jgi:hypothetical protein
VAIESLFGRFRNRTALVTLWEDPECETEVMFGRDTGAVTPRPGLQNVVLSRLRERRGLALRRPVRLV